MRPTMRRSRTPKSSLQEQRGLSHRIESPISLWKGGWGVRLLMLLMLSSCVPARDVPPQLSATPAQSYQVTDEALITDLYRVTPPDGWRIIAGPADAPFTFQFINPDDTALIILSDRPLNPRELPHPARLSEYPIDDLIGGVSVVERQQGAWLNIGFIGLLEDQAALEAIFRQVAASVQ